MAAAARAFGALAPETRGVLAVVFAFFCFGLQDSTAKFLVGELHPMQVVWARYAGQMAIILVLLAPRLRPMARTAHPGLQLVRSALLFASTVLFFTALSMMELAEAAALIQTAPLFITALAAPLLGELVGIRRWAGVAIGLMGALVIIRPGLEVFQPAGLLPLAGAVCLASYQIATRMLSAADRIQTTMLYTAGVGTLVATLLVPFFWTQPTAVQAGLMALMGVIASVGHLSLVYGFGLAQASALAPFNYTALVWATLFGYLFFAELPDAATVAGAALVVAAGLYVWHRERRRKLAAPPVGG